MAVACPFNSNAGFPGGQINKCRNCLGLKILPATVPARSAQAFLARPAR
jgi:hypothetical protein